MFPNVCHHVFSWRQPNPTQYRTSQIWSDYPGDEKTVRWYQLLDAKFSLATVGGKPVATVTYTLTDGQLGDSTGVDGKIVDPAGLCYSH